MILEEQINDLSLFWLLMEILCDGTHNLSNWCEQYSISKVCILGYQVHTHLLYCIEYYGHYKYTGVGSIVHPPFTYLGDYLKWMVELNIITKINQHHYHHDVITILLFF